MLSIGMVFWIVMIIWLVFHGYRNYSAQPGQPWSLPDPIIFILFLLLGVSAYGWPIGGK